MSIEITSRTTHPLLPTRSARERYDRYLRLIGGALAVLVLVGFMLTQRDAAPVHASGPSSASAGMLSIESAHSVDETSARLEAALDRRGLEVLAVVDHAAGAAANGTALRPTRTLIFEDPALRASLMQSSQMAGLDLPLRVLIWEDSAGEVRLAYMAPRALAEGHDAAVDPARVEAMERELEVLLEQAAR